MSRLSKREIGLELARRANQFHSGKNPMTIDLLGLFAWGDVSHCIKTGELTTIFKKENKTIWVRPSITFYNKWVKTHVNYKESESELS